MLEPISLTVEHARLIYSQQIVFDDLSLSIAGGLWTCILGPSGVGKSSLLRLMAGLAPADMQGEITSSNGKSLIENVAFMPQDDLLLPWLSVLDNVLLSNKFNKLPPMDDTAIELLTAVGLKKVLHQKPRTLSGGMRQRVALVRTLLQNKPIIVMDEPFAALDVINRLTLQTLAFELLANKTVVLVTHDPLEALRLAHHLYILSGTPATLSAPIIPTTLPLRQVQDREVLNLQAELLMQLTAAAEGQ